MANHRFGRLELKQQNVPGGHVPKTSADILFRQLRIRAGGDDDRVAAVIVNGDERPACLRPANNVHMPGVDALAGESAAHEVAVGVVAGRADHGGGRTGTRCRDGLVRALATRSDDDLGAKDGLAGRGYAAHADAVVGVEATDDIYVSHGPPRSDR